MSEGTALGGSASEGNTNSGTQSNSSSSGVGTGGNSSSSSSSGGQSTWRDTLPTEIKDNPILSKYSDVGNLAKAYIHAQQQISKKGAIVPDWDKASDEDRNAFFKAIGVPEADKYEVKLSDGVKIPEETMKWFKETALKNGLLPKQAAAVVEGYMSFEKQAIENMQKTRSKQQNDQIEGLKKEWGDAYQKEIGTAQFAAKEIGGDQFVKYLNESGLGNDTNLIRVFSKVGKLLGEDKLREAGVSDGKMSPGDIDAQISELRGKGNENGLYDATHPMHKSTVDKLASLYKMKTGGR